MPPLLSSRTAAGRVVDALDAKNRVDFRNIKLMISKFAVYFPKICYVGHLVGQVSGLYLKISSVGKWIKVWCQKQNYFF